MTSPRQSAPRPSAFRQSAHYRAVAHLHGAPRQSSQVLTNVLFFCALAAAAITLLVQYIGF